MSVSALVAHVDEGSATNWAAPERYVGFWGCPVQRSWQQQRGHLPKREALGAGSGVAGVVERFGTNGRVDALAEDLDL